MNALYGINDDIKKNLLDLFLIINNQVFSKEYHFGTFFDFLEYNFKIIKQYFGISLKYIEIKNELYKIKKSQEETQKDYLFNKINKYIKNSNKKIYNIIISFYYIFIYECKDKYMENKSNVSLIANTYINLMLKNFVIFLNEKYKTLISDMNCFELLRNLYLYDIQPSETKTFYFREINSTIKSHPIYNLNYEILRKKYSEHENENDGFISLGWKKIKNFFSTGKDLSYYEKIIKLKPLYKNIVSNTITILIDGFCTENNDEVKSWKDFINYFDGETMFYFFKWPSNSYLKIIFETVISEIAGICILKDIKNIFGHLFGIGLVSKIDDLPKYFTEAKKNAKICGKILAYFLISSEFFRKYQINLVGFSLGNHVIKHCLKELHKIYYASNFRDCIKFKNIIFIAGATQISNKNIWKRYIEHFVTDRIINCFTKNDWILSKLYRYFMVNKKPIGIDKLEIKDDHNINLVTNYDFSSYGFGHLDYKYKIVAENIFKQYKDI